MHLEGVAVLCSAYLCLILIPEIHCLGEVEVYQGLVGSRPDQNGDVIVIRENKQKGALSASTLRLRIRPPLHLNNNAVGSQNRSLFQYYCAAAPLTPSRIGHHAVVVHEFNLLSNLRHKYMFSDTKLARKFPATAITYLNCAGLNFTSKLKSIIETEVPAIMLINIGNMTSMRKVVQDYQDIRTYRHEGFKVFLLFQTEIDLTSSTLLTQLFSGNGRLPDMSSDFYIVQPRPAVPAADDGKSLFRIHEIYSVKNITFIERIRQPPGSQSSISQELLAKAARRQNFAQVQIRGVVPIPNNVAGRDISYSVGPDKVTGKLKFIGGYRVEEFVYLQDSLNFTAVPVLGEGYISLGPDGKLRGIGKNVVDDEADIGIPSSEIVPYRLKFLTFLHPTSDQKLVAYFKQLPASSVREIYRQSFSRELWIAFSSFWIFFGASVVLLYWLWIGSGANTDGNLSRADKGIGLWDYVLWTVSVALQQGSFRLHKRETPWIKVVIISGVLTSLILYSAYCGSLTSILTTPVLPVKSFGDILDHRFVLYGEKFTLQAKTLLTALRGEPSERPDLDPGHTWGTMDFEGDHAVATITGSKATLIAPSKLFYSYLREKGYAERFTCEEISGVDLNVYRSKTGMFVKKGSPLKEALNYKILHMFERGIRHRIEARFDRNTTITCYRLGQGSGFQASLGIKDVFTGTIILAIGFFLSTIVFIIEKCTRLSRRTPIMGYIE